MMAAGLEFGELYEFWIVAHTIIGEGARSKVVSARPIQDGKDPSAGLPADTNSFHVSPGSHHELLSRHPLPLQPEPQSPLQHGGPPPAPPHLDCQRRAGPLRQQLSGGVEDCRALN